MKGLTYIVQAAQSLLNPGQHVWDEHCEVYELLFNLHSKQYRNQMKTWVYTASWIMCSSVASSLFLLWKTWWHLVNDSCQNLKRKATAKERHTSVACWQDEQNLGNFWTVSPCDFLCCFRNFLFSFHTRRCVSEAICFHLPAPPLLDPSPETNTDFKKRERERDKKKRLLIFPTAFISHFLSILW